MNSQNYKDVKVPRRINIIDVIIILLVIALAAGVSVRFNLAGKLALQADNKTFYVTFLVQNIQTGSQDNFDSGDSFFQLSNNQKFGDLDKILSFSPNQQFVTLQDGSLVQADVPGRIDVQGVIKCVGRMENGNYMIGGNTYVAPGSQFSVFNPRVSVSFTVLAVSDVEP